MPTQTDIEDMISSYTTEGEAELMAELLEMEEDEDDNMVTSSTRTTTEPED